LNQSENGILRGSARSIEGLNITEAITTQKDLLLNFGGHPMAAGLALPVEKLAQFRKGLGKAIEEQLGNVVRQEPTLQIDAWLGLDEINLEFAEELEALAPFGAGNPSLTMATHRVSLRSVANIGKTREHLRLNIEDENGNVQSVLWWGGAGETLPEEGSKFDIAYSMRASTFRGSKQVTLQFEEYRIVEEVPPELRKHKIEIVDYRLEFVHESAEDVRQVLDYVAREEVDAGVVYSSDAFSAGSKVKVVASAPNDSHDPIRYPIALVRDSQQKEAARKFIDLVLSTEGQAALVKHGFQTIK